MQKRFPALNPELVFGIAASLLLHGSLFGVKAFQQPAIATFDSGDISVELTLLPSIASVAAEQPAPAKPEPPKEKNEPIIETLEPAPPIIEPETVQPVEAPEDPPPEPVQEPPEPVIEECVNSVDKDGALDEDKGVFSKAKTQSQCSPLYPRISRRRGEEGIVILSIDVSTFGQGSNIQIVHSSGHSRLDKAAIKAIEKAQFSPAIRFGKPHASTLIQTFNFRLTDEQ